MENVSGKNVTVLGAARKPPGVHDGLDDLVGQRLVLELANGPLAANRIYHVHSSFPSWALAMLANS